MLRRTGHILLSFTKMQQTDNNSLEEDQKDDRDT